MKKPKLSKTQQDLLDRLNREEEVYQSFSTMSYSHHFYRGSDGKKVDSSARALIEKGYAEVASYNNKTILLPIDSPLLAEIKKRANRVWIIQRWGDFLSRKLDHSAIPTDILVEPSDNLDAVVLKALKKSKQGKTTEQQEPWSAEHGKKALEDAAALIKEAKEDNQ